MVFSVFHDSLTNLWILCELFHIIVAFIAATVIIDVVATISLSLLSSQLSLTLATILFTRLWRLLWLPYDQYDELSLLLLSSWVLFCRHSSVPFWIMLLYRGHGYNGTDEADAHRSKTETDQSGDGGWCFRSSSNVGVWMLMLSQVVKWREGMDANGVSGCQVTWDCGANVVLGWWQLCQGLPRCTKDGGKHFCST